jgi:hypothetical protein
MSTPSLFQNMVQNGGLSAGGQVLTLGANGPSWTSTEMPDTGLFVKGNAEIRGTLTVGGQEITKTIDDRLTAIEERLAILRPDPELESRWDELKQARLRYMELEAEFRSYERVIDILKT